MLIILSLGITTTYDIVVGDEVPQVNSLPVGSYEKTIIFDHADLEKEYWENIQRPLYILDKVCPEASQWVRDCKEKNMIVFKKENDGCYAKFDFLNKNLVINNSLFDQNNGTIASILAHEFRHSRQNFSIYFKSIIAHVILREPKYSIVEDDAEFFEAKVTLAIFH